MIDKVEALMRAVADEVVLPRFGSLTDAEIHHKGVGDLVTSADQAAEMLLASGLTAILPGSTVVGEEAVAADSRLMASVSSSGLVWLVDPIDGTSNYVAAQTPFAMMVALQRDGQTTASWILDPVSGRAAVAERGSGAWLGDVRVTSPREGRPAGLLRGPIATRHAPPGVRRVLSAGSARISAVLPGRNCTGAEYPALVSDEQQFAFFWRTLPWDHAPGVLFLQEAGGVAKRMDATPYAAWQTAPGLLVAQNQSVWEVVRTALLAGVA